MSDEPGAPRSPTGTHDVLPPESARWEALLAGFAGLAERYGFGMVHTPLFEDARVFHRGIGEGSEVVGKEMYEFTDRGGRQLALRPEGTASIVRAFVQHRPPTPWRAWYATPSFRYERPQAGRYRQHHQVGVEALGSDDPDVDVEVVSLAQRFFESLGLERFVLSVNSMGDRQCRPAYIESLRAFLAERSSELCEEHGRRYSENPLRVLDCKKPPCLAATAAAPMLIDVLCKDCATHHERVLAGLDAAGIAYVRNDRLVRGFDYYTRTTFEFSSAALEGAQNAIGGGGRYDGLVELLGGPPTPGIGFGIGIERVLLACDAEGCFVVPAPVPAAFVVDVTGGEAARDLVAALRQRGLRAERAYDGRSMKSQLKAADRSGAPLALLIGSEELAQKSVTIRALRETREQTAVSVEELLDAIEDTGEITW
jgi:histidyl-tRNA synthetase